MLKKQTKHWSDEIPVVFIAVSIAIVSTFKLGIFNGFILGGLFGAIGVLISYIIKGKFKTMISDFVKNYDTYKWYQHPKYWILLWAIFAVIAGAFIQLSNTDVIFGMLGFLMALFTLTPFIIKGYIFPFILLIIFKSYDMVLTLGQTPHAAWSIIGFGFIWIGICITCIRIEVLRNKTAPVKKRFWKDLLYSLTILFIGLLLTVGISFIQDKRSSNIVREEIRTVYYEKCYNEIKDDAKNPNEQNILKNFCICRSDFIANSYDQFNDIFNKLSSSDKTEDEKMGIALEEVIKKADEKCLNNSN